MVKSFADATRDKAPEPKTLDEAIEASARRVAAKVWALPVPEPEYCGFSCRLYDNKEHAVFGADGIYFEVDPCDTGDFTFDPERLRATFFGVFIDEMTDRHAKDILVSGAWRLGTVQHIAIRNRAMVLIERRAMNFDRNGREF